MIELGGNIELVGFSEIDGGSMIVLKKIVGNYVKKLSSIADNFEKLTLTLKKVHEREKSEKYEIHGKLMDGGKAYTSEVTDRNLFFGVNKALEKIESALSKE
ncbi:hypothetical protein D6745_00990 [Candidatus Woesearchaeota archaeon]|nr:MAG: hypothetical protein D6745_00990 [Candidatus Woesearchaeota archaeon]